MKALVRRSLSGLARASAQPMRGDAEGGLGAAPRTVAYAFASCSSCAGPYDPPASFLIACSSASAVSWERSLRFSPDMGTDDSREIR